LSAPPDLANTPKSRRSPRRPATVPGIHSMQSPAVILLSVLFATSAAVGVSFVLKNQEASPSGGAAEVTAALEELRTQQRLMQQQLATLQSAPAAALAAPAGVERSAATVSPDQLAAAVEAYLQKRGGAVAGEAAVKSGAVSFDLATEFDQLVGNNYWESTEAWKKAFAAGKMDEVLAQFEALAKQSPNDTKVQMDLANAYLAYLQMDQSKWQLSMKADSVFDKVLAQDEGHWEARFTKAMSYTFWPDFLGKKKDAIGHFETLVRQQESMPVQASHAQTYLYLGNLLEARDPAKAREMWQKGARRHPDNAELAKKANG
jgi:tetratricopeptide (TPR) repeat protein